jgi:hypothetical protein
MREIALGEGFLRGGTDGYVNSHTLIHASVGGAEIASREPLRQGFCSGYSFIHLTSELRF